MHTTLDIIIWVEGIVLLVVIVLSFAVVLSYLFTRIASKTSLDQEVHPEFGQHSMIELESEDRSEDSSSVRGVILMEDPKPDCVLTHTNKELK